LFDRIQKVKVESLEHTNSNIELARTQFNLKMETVNNVVEIITIELGKDNKKRSDIILD